MVTSDRKSIGAVGRDYSKMETQELHKIHWHTIRAHSGCTYGKPCKFHGHDLRAQAHELAKRQKLSDKECARLRLC